MPLFFTVCGRFVLHYDTYSDFPTIRIYISFIRAYLLCQLLCSQVNQFQERQLFNNLLRFISEYLPKQQAYFREDMPLVCTDNGGCTMPDYFRKRYYRIFKAAGIESRGIHRFPHPYVKAETKSGFSALKSSLIRFSRS